MLSYRDREAHTQRPVQYHLPARRPGARPVDRRHHHARSTQTSTYVQEELGRHKGFEYGRTQNPTRLALERNIAAIECGKAAFAFASGMAAIGAIATMLKSGDHVIVSDNTYGGTFRLFDKVLTRYQLSFSYVDTSNLDAGRARDDAGDEDAVRRDADQSDVQDHGPPGGGRARAPAPPAARRRQHVRQPVHPAADRARRGPGHAQHDEVPQRPQRQRRRRRRSRSATTTSSG